MDEIRKIYHSKKISQIIHLNESKKGKDINQKIMIDQSLNVSDSTLQDSSITAHMNQCFAEPEITPKSFLKKRSGLKRYRPKSPITNQEGTSVVQPSRGTNSVFPLVSEKAVAPSHFLKHRSSHYAKKVTLLDYPYESNESASESCNVNNHVSDKDKNPIMMDRQDDGQNHNVIHFHNPNPSTDNYDKEEKEMAVFELLEEKCQHSSFNSDSSYVQNVLNGVLEPLTTPSNNANDGIFRRNEIEFQEHPNLASRKIFTTETGIRKQNLKNKVSHMEDKLESFQQAISHKGLDDLSSDERCSTPILQNGQDRIQASLTSSHEQTEIASIEESPHNSIDPITCFENYEDGDNEINGDPPGDNKEFYISYDVLKKKVEKLNREIQSYEKLNESAKQRNEVLKDHQKKVEKERADVEEDRKQLRREKESFQRLKKLQKENPSRKEREDVQLLNKEIEKQQEEFKRLKIKSSNEIRKLKNQLMSVEKERDVLKSQVITLEEQREDLICVFKNRQNGISSEFLKITPIADKATNTEDDLLANKKPEGLKERNLYGVTTKPKVHFNLVPSLKMFERYESDISDKFEADEVENQYTSSTIPQPINEIADLETQLPIDHDEIQKGISLMALGRMDEDVSDKLDTSRTDVKITKLRTGHKLIEFPDGQIQEVQPDGKITVKFPDGTISIFHIDGSEETITTNGTRVTQSFDGVVTVEYQNGDVEIRTKDSIRREYHDGAIKIIYASGRQETRYPNGRMRIKDKEGALLFDTKKYQDTVVS